MSHITQLEQSGNFKFIKALKELHNNPALQILDESDEDEDVDEIDLSVPMSEVVRQLNEPTMAKIVKSMPELTWPQKIRLMEHADLSDEQAVGIFDSYIIEVHKMRVLHLADDKWDMGQYGPCIKLIKRSLSKRREGVEVSKDGKPVQGTKIKDALMSVTDIPVKISDLAARFNVSVHVLTQFNRFAKPEYFPIGMTITRIVVNGEKYLRLTKIA